METISVHEAVRRAIDPWGMEGQHTTAMRPTASEVIDRLLSQGYVIVPADVETTGMESIAELDRYITESEQRLLDGNR
jgi:hypothetical protein